MLLSRKAKSSAVPYEVIVIGPRHGWRELGLRELWAHKELLFFFIWRDLKVRYKQTAFGAAWAVIQPVALMLVFSVTVGRLKGVGPEGIPYPLFVFAGLVPWTLFASSLGGAANSLVVSEHVITKVYFPRLLLPFASVGSFVLDFFISLGVLAIVMLIFGATPNWAILLLPAFTLMVLVAALSVGTFLSAVNVRYRDVKYVMPFLIQIWMFGSPVIYTSSLVPEQFRLLYALNPMTGAINGFRWALVGGPQPDAAIFISAAASVALLILSLAYFRRMEQTFVDVI